MSGAPQFAVPIVLGGLPGDYQRLAPPNSFLHVDHFKGPQHLADTVHIILDLPNTSLLGKD